jgi:hypothetical protein
MSLKACLLQEHVYHSIAGNDFFSIYASRQACNNLKEFNNNKEL